METEGRGWTEEPNNFVDERLGGGSVAAAARGGRGEESRLLRIEGEMRDEKER